MKNTTTDSNFPSATSNHSIYSFESCCICGRSTCEESTDHTQITLKHIFQQIHSFTAINPSLTSIKHSIANKYQTFKNHLMQKIIEDQHHLQQMLNQYYFRTNHSQEYQKIKNFNKVNMKLLCEIVDESYENLPNKNITKIYKFLLKNKPKQHLQSEQLIKIIEDTNNFIKQFDFESMSNKIMDQLGVQKILNKKMLHLKAKKSIKSMSSTDTSNPQEQTNELYLQVYEWKNIKLKQNTKNIDLSNKNITDFDMIRQIPKICTFSKLKQLEIRNNKITALSCKLIANNMSHLLVLDIRSNNIGDEGVIKIVRHLCQLKQLFISETGAGDSSGREIINGLPALEMFWSEHTFLSGAIAVSIGRKSKLKVMSVAGNLIDQISAEELKNIFNSKGYVVI